MSRTRTVLVAVAVALALSLALATGASVIDGSADTFADDRVAIQPADGPNGDYAYLDDDDDLVIDVSASNPNLDEEAFGGVNVNSRTVIGDVFTVTYTADEAADVWLEHDIDGVSFVVADDAADGPEPGYRLVDDEGATVSLAPNESVSVGLVIDTTDADAAPGTLTESAFAIHANVVEPEATSSGTALDLTPSGPDRTVESLGPSDRRFAASGVEDDDTVRFDADEMQLDHRNVTLDRLDLLGASSGSYELEAAGGPGVDEADPLDAPGDPLPLGYLTLEYDLDPDDVEGLRVLFSADSEFLERHDATPDDVTLYRQTDDGEWAEIDAATVDERVVEMRGSPPDRTHFSATSEGLSVFAVAAHVPHIEANDASLATDSIDAGAETTVEAVVENEGGAAGERSLTLTADGDPIATRDVALAPGESTTVSFPVSLEAAGEYELAIDGDPAGTLRVDATGTDAEGDDPAPSDGDDVDPAVDDDAGTTDGESGPSGTDDFDGPTEEPGGFGLDEAVGFSALLLIIAASLFLVRRAPSGR